METMEICHSDSKEWMIKYDNYIRYALKLISNQENIKNSRLSARDLVHDAYLLWKSEKKEDLFSRAPGTVCRVIKNVHWSKIQKNKWSKNGVFRTRTYVREGAEDKYPFPLAVSKGELTSRQSYINEEWVDRFKETLNAFDRKVLDLKLEGYRAKEIEKKLKRTNPIITKSLKTIKQKMSNSLLNPFNGSRVKVVKRVKRNTYDANQKDYANFEKGDEFLENEYYTLLTSKTNPKEGLLIKEELRD